MLARARRRQTARPTPKPPASASSESRGSRPRRNRDKPAQESRPRCKAGYSTYRTPHQFKNGNHIEVEGTVFKILEFQHVKPGKGGAFVRTKLRRAADGAVIDRTFRAGEKFRAVRTEARKMQFLYADGTDAHFMDTESYEQIAVPETSVAEALRWTKPNDSVDVLFIDGRPSGPAAAGLRRARGHADRARRCAATRPRAAAPSPPRSRPAPRSRSRCSSTSGDRIKVDTRRATTCRAPEPAQRLPATTMSDDRTSGAQRSSPSTSTTSPAAGSTT